MLSTYFPIQRTRDGYKGPVPIFSLIAWLRPNWRTKCIVFLKIDIKPSSSRAIHVVPETQTPSKSLSGWELLALKFCCVTRDARRRCFDVHVFTYKNTNSRRLMEETTIHAIVLETDLKFNFKYTENTHYIETCMIHKRYFSLNC